MADQHASVPVLGIYTPDDNLEALDLERNCAQGDSYRISFNRSTFHRRAENFPTRRIITARVDGRLVGLAAAAIKEVTLFGRPETAAFFFDMRVHPDYRSRGIGRRLMQEAVAWGRTRATLLYTYTVAENRIVTAMTKSIAGYEAGGYSYLVYPVYRRVRPRHHASAEGFATVHEAMLKASPPFDFYSRPDCRPGKGGYVASWMIRSGTERAGCSVWNNRGILGEVIESVPFPYKIARAITGRWPVNRIPFPHIPRSGEELRSWYLFDWFATDPLLARDLMRHVAGEALERGIDYCYLPHDPGEPWVEAVRSDIPALFSPVIPYRLLIRREEAAGRVRIRRLYVDIRDL